MHILVRGYDINSWKDIYLAKQDKDLYVVKSESINTSKIFSTFYYPLSEMYDELLKYADYKDYKYERNDIKPVNSNFSINISSDGICLLVKDSTKNSTYKLELLAPSYDNSYKLNCNSSIINEAFKGKEDEIFKRIHVKISYCPKWSQSRLYKMRQNQLVKEQKYENTIKYYEIKKQKRLELARKIFPFLNR